MQSKTVCHLLIARLPSVCSPKNPRSCSDFALCNFGTETKNGFTKWSTDQLWASYVTEAKRRNLSCGVNAKISESPYTRCEKNLKDCSNNDLCSISVYKTNNVTKWKTGSYAKFVNEAKKRNLSCGVIEKSAQIGCTFTTNDIKACKDIDVCSWATVGNQKQWWTQNPSATRWINEAKRRNLQCGVKSTKNLDNTPYARCDKNIYSCSAADLCSVATYMSNGKKVWQKYTFSKFANEAKRRGISCGVSEISCAMASNYARVINVNSFVNIREGASLGDRIITQAFKGERLKVLEPNMWWYKVTSRGKDCSEICTQYHSNKSDTILAQRAQQCISDKEIWIKVQKNGL